MTVLGRQQRNLNSGINSSAGVKIVTKNKKVDSAASQYEHRMQTGRLYNNRW